MLTEFVGYQREKDELRIYFIAEITRIYVKNSFSPPYTKAKGYFLQFLV